MPQNARGLRNHSNNLPFSSNNRKKWCPSHTALVTRSPPPHDSATGDIPPNSIHSLPATSNKNKNAYVVIGTVAIQARSYRIYVLLMIHLERSLILTLCKTLCKTYCIYFRAILQPVNLGVVLQTKLKYRTTTSNIVTRQFLPK